VCVAFLLTLYKLLQEIYHSEPQYRRKVYQCPSIVDCILWSCGNSPFFYKHLRYKYPKDVGFGCRTYSGSVVRANLTCTFFFSTTFIIFLGHFPCIIIKSLRWYGLVNILSILVHLYGNNFSYFNVAKFVKILLMGICDIKLKVRSTHFFC